MAYVDSSGKTHVSLSEASRGHAAQTTASRNAAGQVVGNSSGSNYARAQEEQARAAEAEKQSKLSSMVYANTGMPAWMTAPGEISEVDRSQIQQFKTVDQLEKEREQKSSVLNKAKGTLVDVWNQSNKAAVGIIGLKPEQLSNADNARKTQINLNHNPENNIQVYSAGSRSKTGLANQGLHDFITTQRNEVAEKPLNFGGNIAVSIGAGYLGGAVLSGGGMVARKGLVKVGLPRVAGVVEPGVNIVLGAAVVKEATELKSVEEGLTFGKDLLVMGAGFKAGQTRVGYYLGKAGKLETNVKQKRQASKLPASELSEVPLKDLTPSKNIPKLRELTLEETPDGIVVKEYASAADLQATKAHSKTLKAKPRKPEPAPTTPKLRELTLEETPDGIVVKEYASAADLQATKAHSKTLKAKPRKPEPAPTTPKFQELTLEETPDGIVVKEYASAADLQATKTRTESLRAKRLKQRKQNHERAPTTPKFQELTLEETPDGIVVKEYASAADLQATKAHSKALRTKPLKPETPSKNIPKLRELTLEETPDGIVVKEYASAADLQATKAHSKALRTKPRKPETPSAAPKLRELTLEETPDGIVVKEYASAADLQATKAHAQALRTKRINSLRSGSESTSRGSLKTLKRSVSTKGLKEFSLNEKASLFPEFPKVSESPSFPELSTYSGSKPRYNRENPLRQIQIEKQAAKRSALLKMEYKQPRELDVLEDVKGPSRLQSDLLPNILRADGPQKGVYAPAFSYSLPFIGQGFLPNLNPQKGKERSLFTASVLPDISSNILDVSSNILDVSSRVNEKNSEKNDNTLFLPTLPEISLTDKTIQKDIVIQDAIQKQIPDEIFDIPELTTTSGGFDPRPPYIPNTKKPVVLLDDPLNIFRGSTDKPKRRKTKQKTIKNEYGDPFKIKL